MCKQLSAAMALASFAQGWDEGGEAEQNLQCWGAHSALPQLGQGSNLTPLGAALAGPGPDPRLQVWALHHPTPLVYLCRHRQHRGHQWGGNLVELSQGTSRWQELNLLQVVSEPDGREMCVLHTAEQSISLHSSTLCSALCLTLVWFFISFMFSCTFALLQGLEKVLSECLCLMLWFCVCW